MLRRHGRHAWMAASLSLTSNSSAIKAPIAVSSMPPVQHVEASFAWLAVSMRDPTSSPLDF